MGRAVAIGGAEGWRDELDALIATGWQPDYYLACNDAGTELDPLDHWCTLHPERLLDKNPLHSKKWPWVRQRDENGLPADYVTWSHGGEPPTDRQLTGWSDGSSGLFTVGVGLQLAQTVVCCGIRMDTHRNKYHDTDWRKAKNYRRGWERLEDVMKGRVFSMSGWTARMLGRPPWMAEAA